MLLLTRLCVHGQRERFRCSIDLVMSWRITQHSPRGQSHRGLSSFQLDINELHNEAVLSGNV